MDLANKFAANCESPLSNLAKVNSTPMTTPEKIRSLRFFAATGANDAFPLLEQVTKEAIGKDENLLTFLHKMSLPSSSHNREIFW